MHMYATLSMGGATQSHKKVDATRSWVLYQYYTSKVSYHDAIAWWLHTALTNVSLQVVLFICCALNELFFIGLYLLSFSSPTLSPSLLQPIPEAEPSSAQPGNPAHAAPSSLFASPWSAGALEMARANKIDSFWPWVITGVSAPIMAFKQFVNIVQMVNASKMMVEGDLTNRKAALNGKKR